MNINYNLLSADELVNEIVNSIKDIEVCTKSELAYKINDKGEREILYSMDEKGNLEKDFRDIDYLNVACAFDTETSSIQLNGVNCGTMYAYGFGYNGNVTIGRTWKEFVDLLMEIKKALNLKKNRRLVVYVHNLSFDFQFMRKYLDFCDVFMVSSRKIVRAVCSEGFEFRCSYIQSGYSLDNLKLKKYDIKKLVGQCDYSLIRHSETPLTEKEKNYLRNDVLKCMAYIDEKIDEDGDITKILLTKTGYIRTLMRNACLNRVNKEENKKYRSLMKKLQMGYREYLFLKNCFAGGFTHANGYHTGERCKNVESLDITSDYPTVMVSEKFPMSSPDKVYNITEKTFNKYIYMYACAFEVVFINIKSKVNFDHPISESKCEIEGTSIIDNGRVVQVNGILTTKMTDVDWKVISKYYEWDDFMITEFYKFKKDYLPKEIIDTVLQLYDGKTKLKGVKGQECEYALMKELLNSCYGMMVTDPLKDCDDYNYKEQNYTHPDLSTKEDFEKKIKSDREKLNEYNNSYNRFLFYGWGIWITAYARSRLLNAIYECGEDHRYSDTDSEKCVNYKIHKDYFDKDNAEIDLKLYLSSKNVGWNIELSKPKNIKGVTKPLGHWDDEGCYEDFTSLGAKRYIYTKRHDDNIIINATVSGIPKVNMCNYLVDENKSNEYFRENEGIIVNEEQVNMAFDKFSGDLFIDENCSGKRTHTYTDFEVKGWVTDYLGNKYFVDDKSSVFISSASFDMKLSEQYKDYLLMVRGVTDNLNIHETIIN